MRRTTSAVTAASESRRARLAGEIVSPGAASLCIRSTTRRADSRRASACVNACARSCWVASNATVSAAGRGTSAASRRRSPSRIGAARSTAVISTKPLTAAPIEQRSPAAHVAGAPPEPGRASGRATPRAWPPSRRRRRGRHRPLGRRRRRDAGRRGRHHGHCHSRFIAHREPFSRLAPDSDRPVAP